MASTYVIRILLVYPRRQHTPLSGANTHPVWLADKPAEGDLIISLLNTFACERPLLFDPHYRKLLKFKTSKLLQDLLVQVQCQSFFSSHFPQYLHMANTVWFFRKDHAYGQMLIVHL